MTDKDHDGAGQAPDGKAQSATDADAELDEQFEGLPPEDSTPPTEPELYALEYGDRLEMVQHGKVLGVVICKAAPLDPEIRLAPLYAALAKAQGEFPEIPKNRTATIRPQTGEQWSYKYSDLSDLIKAVREPLAKHGLGFYQYPTEDGKNLATVVFHQTGLFIETLYPLHQTTGGRMHPAQNYSVGGTYAKRNGLSAALGVASEETVEGNQSDKTTSDFDSSSGDGVLTVRGVVIPDGATKADKARLYGEGIETQVRAASTLKGLDGVWKRNEEVINALQDHFRDAYENVLDAYGSAQARIAGDGVDPAGHL